ncbi:hypothetical protein DS909_05890 [Phaeobacter gallaeciensis]|uniref:Uncharacterized protein n=1 Tax=Phaeobacter gallaeciensis TaxID=60890 RepID=A0A366X384_9RHOB|nr:hypothetical protein DS909_05890 [Phaeobacter gallaeciensis]
MLVFNNLHLGLKITLRNTFRIFKKVSCDYQMRDGNRGIDICTLRTDKSEADFLACSDHSPFSDACLFPLLSCWDSLHK